MIRWCSFCQRFIGEVPPLTRFEISHGACAECGPRLLDGADPTAEDRAASELYGRLFESAAAGDPRTCAGIIDEARGRRYRTVDLLLGMMQPALCEIGARWEAGLVSVAEEHAFSAWCDVAISLLQQDQPRRAEKGSSLDLLILAAPGNLHMLGPRIASLCLADEGFAIAHILPELPSSEVVEQTLKRGPRWVGFSCSLKTQVDAALELARLLRRAGFEGGVMLSGQALRRAPDTAVGLDVTICLTLDAVSATIGDAHCPPGSN